MKTSEIHTYLSTIITTEDSKRFKASIGQHDLNAVQGEITKPFSFDVHNMIPDSIVFSLPKNFEKEKLTLNLSYSNQFQAGIVDVFHNTNDHLGLVVDSESDGWFLYHTPFSKQFKVMMNDTEIPIYKANGAFIAVPLKKGINRIEYLYKPNNKIPTLILLSLILSLLFLIVLITKELIFNKISIIANIKNQIT